MLEVNNLTVSYGAYKVVDSLSFSVSEGKWLMVVGPNGAGKSTVLNAITQGADYSGTVLLNGTDIKSQKAIWRARKIGMLAQNHHVGYDFTVEEIVRMGRYAHGNKDTDNKAVEYAMEITGMASFRDKSVLTLSGGELQRTFLAQVFAQEPKVLLLDEPTNHLDLVYQKQVFSLIGEWLKTPGRIVISVVHDLSLAKAFGTDALLMDKGRAILCGEINDVLSSCQLDKAYGMDVSAWMRTMLSQWDK